MNNKRFLVLMSLLVLSVSVSTASAAMVVQDQFLTSEYTADVNLVGQNGGMGFSGAWTSSDAFADTVRFDPQASGLTYVNMDATNGGLEHYRTSGSASTKTVTHALSYTAPTITGANVAYFGFLFNSSVRLEALWTGGPDAEPDKYVNQFIFTGTEMVLLGGGAAGSQIRVNAPAGQDSLVLIRISDNTSHTYEEYYDNIEMWVNPDLTNLGAADGTGIAVFSKFEGGNVDTAARQLSLTAQLAAGESFQVDEFFFTNDLNDIIVPEPMTLGLLGFGGLAILKRRQN